MKSIKHLTLCHEVEIHYKRPLFDTSQKISGSESAVELLRGYGNEKRIDHKEFFWLLLLNNSNHVIGVSEIAVGSTTGVSVNFKEILQLVILTNAVGIIVAHNHPSGTLEPSRSDVQFTSRLKKATSLFDVTLLDHLIITSESFTSLSDDGKL